jgi:hypothetical protein
MLQVRDFEPDGHDEAEVSRLCCFFDWSLENTDDPLTGLQQVDQGFI